MYISSPDLTTNDTRGLCLKCFAYCRDHPSLLDASPLSVPSLGVYDHPRERCTFCGGLCEGGKEKLFRASEASSRINPVQTEEAKSGMEALTEVCAFHVEEEGEGLERTLWEGWGNTQPPQSKDWGGEHISEESTSNEGTSSQTTCSK